MREWLRSAWVGLAVLACIVPLGTGCDPKPVRKKAQMKYWGPFTPQEETSGKSGGSGGDPDQGFGPTAGKLEFEANGAPKGQPVGTIRGVIKYKAAAPKRTRVDLNKDPWCVKNVKEVLKDDAIVDAQGNVANCVVVIELGMNKQSMPVPSSSARLLQKGCMYIPHVLTMRAGQNLEMVHDDNGTSHNYRYTGNANESINVTQGKPGTDNVKTIKKAETFASFNCDVHPWMLAVVHVFTHDYFVRTAEDGKFELKNVPPGRYRLAFLHEKWTSAPKEIVVGGPEGVDVGEIVLQ